MKFFIVGSPEPHSGESACARLLREKGCEVTIWDNKVPSLFSGWRSWWDLPRPAAAAYDAVASYRFYHAARAYRPDVLFMPKAENIHSYAVRRVLEETKARLVVWYPDNPFKADQTSMNILRNLRRCDLFYIWGKFLIEPLRAAGCRRVEYLPFGFDPSLHPVDTVLTAEDHKRFGCGVTFVGTWDVERERALAPLAEFDLAIWGPYWPARLAADSPLRRCVRGGGLYGAEMVKAFRASRVVFNHLREHNGPAHNVRTMEITGIGGGPMVVRRTVEQARELFTESEHLRCFDGDAELSSVCRDVLSQPGHGESMARLARLRVLEQHLLAFRIDKILHDLAR